MSIPGEISVVDIVCIANKRNGMQVLRVVNRDRVKRRNGEDDSIRNLKMWR